MMKIEKLLIAMCALSLTACNSDNRNAKALLERANQSFVRFDYELAKLQIDSIRKLYPKETELRKEGVKLMQMVELEEQTKTLTFLKDALAKQTAAVDSAKGEFVLEKNAEYQQVGNYFYPTQLPERNDGRSYLRAKVSEQGRFSLTSVYCAGGRMHHNRVKVVSGDVFAETPVSGDTYEMNLGSRVVELADYPRAKDGGVVALLLKVRPTDKVQLIFEGEKTFATFLTPDDVKAVQALARFSALLETREKTNAQIKEAELKIRFLKQRQSELIGTVQD